MPDNDFTPAIVEFHEKRAASRVAYDPMRVALLEIEQISDCCVNAEHYTAEDALRDLQEIRNVIKRTELSR